ncbi:hypothetical protein B0I35DRAFT_469369 [Stachybotrys elegans]|uniref:Protein kinase domain-containing protein n=1 Tax=Stachybotrys elegans TaxID=80388 RepID=A0A8K0WR91_9HYPO|nr:hypothetical protein B0I35DRAFT_469369 [Stachybotrys elegans]
MSQPKKRMRTWGRVISVLRSKSPGDQDLLKDFEDRVNHCVLIEELDRSKKFLPHGYIEEWITKDFVAQILQLPGGKGSQTQSLIEYVMNAKRPAKKIFATVAYASAKESDVFDLLTKFKAASFYDSDLPATEHRLSFLGNRKEPLGKLFGYMQWEFMAPVFESSKQKLVISESVPLPFTSFTKCVGEGGFGVVHKATVHEMHRKHWAFTMSKNKADNNGDVALKEVNAEPQAAPEDSQPHAEGGVAQESQALTDLQGLRHPHLIEFIATIHRGNDKHYLMFRWANGQDLGKYWAQNRSPKLSPAFVKAVITQCCGLIDGLTRLHECDKGMYRHTDIKPANILRSVENIQQRPLDIGTLKISDMGLAKKHTMRTSLRKGTVARAATTRYQPPESVFKLTDEGIGRRYDIWSMGCVMLELIIWLLHGTDTLDKFNNVWLGKEPNGRDSKPFFERRPRNVIAVHSVVTNVIESLLKEPECQEKTAIGDLLRLVRDEMLVVAVTEPKRERRHSQSLLPRAQPDFHPMLPDRRRATSGEVLKGFNAILKRGTEEGYWFTGKGRGAVTPLPDPRTPEPLGDSQTVTWEGNPRIEISLSEDDPRPASEPDNVLTARSYGQTHLMNDRWEFVVDNKFPQSLLRHPEFNELFPQQPTSRLCKSCIAMDFTAPFFKISDTRTQLKESQKICDFCKLRWDISANLDPGVVSELVFEREGSVLKLNGSYPPVLSLKRGFGKSIAPLKMLPHVNCNGEADRSGPSDNRIQIGLPRLAPPSSDAAFHTARSWLRNCDDHHAHCRPNQGIGLPTRLLDTGLPGNDTLRLYETKPGDSMSYVALSHPWGLGPHFCTTTANLDSFKQSIDYTKLPATFKHAITVTRQIGQRYIWIDSLCIIQGPDGDFKQEAEKMEIVFASADCVISACSSRGQSDGFLNKFKAKQDGEFVTFPRAGFSPLYICRFIDDFAHDVLESNLSRRGWVLQERALARRTIYFAESQIYWECGEGVQCQSMTKMTNNLASFLGDPKFPSKLSDGSSVRGEKILFYEDLYRQYSRLGFTNIRDKAVAILGLEKRLIHDLGAQGGLGVFDDGRSLLQHSLLWQRGNEFSTLTKIDYGTSHMIPTWSWMAYQEGIDFLDLPLGDVKWLPHEIISPWADAPKQGDAARAIKNPPEISVRVRSVRGEGKMESGDERTIIHDCPAQDLVRDGEERCVLMGSIRDKSKHARNLVYCVLFVRARMAAGVDVYERAGVGFLSAKFIDLESSGVLGRLR